MTIPSYWPLSCSQTIIASLLTPAFTYSHINTTDFLLITLLAISRNRATFFPLFDRHRTLILATSGSIAAVAALYLILVILTSKPIPPDDNHDIDDIKPMFFPCKITHTRLFPKKHSFSYSYLMTGIPVGWRGSVGGLLSIDTEDAKSSKSGKTRDWFAVDPGEYLERGHSHLGLKGKLGQYLRSEDIDPDDYPHAYLVTVPKLLGYIFNPVSFWYLYSARKELRAMILEVNNTFDERRPYFMKIDSNQFEENRVEEESMKMTNGHAKNDKKFTNTWPKDFHVSPFNSRKGFYSLIAADPLYPDMAGTGPIDNTITLLSSKSHPKLVARVCSTGAPIDPSTMNSFSARMKFLAEWWWTVYATDWRTIKEAATLYFKHRLHVWFRPEPLATNMGRKANAVEVDLEAFFRTWLRFMAQNCERPMSVAYTAAGIANSAPATFSSPAARDGENDGTMRLELHVLTPVFYPRFLHYEGVLEALKSEFADSGTIWVSDIRALETLISFSKVDTATRSLDKRRPISTASIITLATNTACMRLIKHLRKTPAILTISQPGKPKTQTPTRPTLPKPGESAKYGSEAWFTSMLQSPASPWTDAAKTHYIRLITKIFWVDTVAKGSMELLWLEGFALRCIGALALVSLLGL